MKKLLTKLTIISSLVLLAGASAFAQSQTNFSDSSGEIFVTLATNGTDLAEINLINPDDEMRFDIQTYSGQGTDLSTYGVLRLVGDEVVPMPGGVAIGWSGTPMQVVVSATGSVNFASTANDATNSVTITVTGASTTNTPSVDIGGAMPSGWDLVQAYVSATDTVTVVGRNKTGSTNDPGAVTLRATVTQF